MSERYWQAKIHGMMYGLGLDSEPSSGLTSAAKALAIASDRALFDHLAKIAEPPQATVTHLLSGKRLNTLSIPPATALQDRIRAAFNQQFNSTHYLDPIPTDETQRSTFRQSLKNQFWWLWRCLPEQIAQLNEDDLTEETPQPKKRYLCPASQILPDVSLWSQSSLTAAMAGALAGYENDQDSDRPYLARFTFTPVQEVIKASRKMRDFWAGSWVLHYLSARICWKLACQYGPDCLIYPSLFQQPLIDHWLLRRWPDFRITPPSPRKLLTAGFPNVIVILLPYSKVRAAMQTAEQTLIETWLGLGVNVLQNLQRKKWMEGLGQDNRTWNGWLRHQWQPYWTALPIGSPSRDLQHILTPDLESLAPWSAEQNRMCNLNGNGLFKETEEEPERELLKTLVTETTTTDQPPIAVNAGSWWPHIFNQLTTIMERVKGARVWQLPTAFGPRSTISGFGPVVYPYGSNVETKNLSESNTAKYWGSAADNLKDRVGLFDGREQLNATETLKRGLHKILAKELEVKEEEIAAAQPDLNAGVAGYLKVHRERLELDSSPNQNNPTEHFHNCCNHIINKFYWAKHVVEEMQGKWGIPFQDNNSGDMSYHPRLLNPGWLVEDAQNDELEKLQRLLITSPETSDQTRQEIISTKAQLREAIRNEIAKFYPDNNPSDWYVLAAGDGDGMRHWLTGRNLQPYSSYTNTLQDLPKSIQEKFQSVIQLKKRIGPSTHAALSRALLDFSNELLPHLTETRYAGRLIYGGGDDVLAYTNLWEWDRWLWDVRECFRGAADPQFLEKGVGFESIGDYWKWSDTDRSPVSSRPLFTMGSNATISFGITIAHHSVPLAITLENLWEAEEGAKTHESLQKKDAVQVRVIFANGNILTCTAKFSAFNVWKNLLPQPGDPQPTITSSLFEQAAQLWNQHPAPTLEAINPWTQIFASRREAFSSDTQRENFRSKLKEFLEELWNTTQETDQFQETQRWLKLAAFICRVRIIKGGRP